MLNKTLNHCHGQKYSRRLLEILGFEENESPEKLQSLQSLIDLVHPEDREPMLKKLDTHFVEHIPYYTELRIKNKQNEYLWCSMKGQALRDNKGKAKNPASNSHYGL